MSLPEPASAEPPDSDAFLGRVLLGRYRIDARLGEGGLGAVYRATHLELERQVAIKVLREDLRGVAQIRARFTREVRALSSLSHPNVVTITDYGVADDLPFLVMELAEGRELSKMVGEALPAERALAIVRQILASLVYAHGRDVVHRDLKPANVIVCQMPDGRDHVVVLDFGLAKFVGDAGPDADLTRSGLVVGTPAYMPPEQMASGARRADARSDIYAAGLIAFELLTGRRPFPFDEPADLLRAHLVEPPPKLVEVMPGSEVAPELETLIATALAKSPDARYSSAKAMIDALDALPHRPLRRGSKTLRHDETRPARPTPIGTRVPDGRRRHAGMVLGMIAAGAVAIAGVALALGSSGGPATEEAPHADVAATPPTPTAAPPAAAAPFVATPVAAAPPIAAAPSAPGEAAEAAPADVAGEDELIGELEEEAPDGLSEGELADNDTMEFVAPAAVVGPRPVPRDPVRGNHLTGVLARVRARLDRGREVRRNDLEALIRYRNERPQDLRARVLLGNAYAARGWLSSALEQYERALAIDPSVRGNVDMLEGLLRAARTESLANRASVVVTSVWGNEAREAVTRAIGRTRDDGERRRLNALAARLGS